MSTNATCARIAAKAKANYAKRNAKSKAKAKSTPKPVVVTVNSPTIEQANKRHRYSREELSEQQTQSSRRDDDEVAQDGWATMGKSGKTRQVNTSESGEIRSATAPTISAPTISAPTISGPDKRGWSQVVYQSHISKQRARKPEPASQVILSGKRISNCLPAVRAPRGWVTRVSDVAGCSPKLSHVELQKAAADCNGRPGSQRSRAILSAAANCGAPALEMPTIRHSTQNVFGILGDQVDSESLFPVLRSKKTEKSKVEPEKIATKGAVLDTTGMDEIDLALALIEAERREKITKDVAKARAKLGVKPVLKPEPAKSMGAWSAKSAWVKKPAPIPRKVTFAEPEVFLFNNVDIERQGQEWEENVADREYEGESHPGYPAGITGWGDQALWDEENGW